MGRVAPKLVCKQYFPWGFSAVSSDVRASLTAFPLPVAVNRQSILSSAIAMAVRPWAPFKKVSICGCFKHGAFGQEAVHGTGPVSLF